MISVSAKKIKHPPEYRVVLELNNGYPDREVGRLFWDIGGYWFEPSDNIVGGPSHLSFDMMDAITDLMARKTDKWKAKLEEQDFEGND